MKKLIYLIALLPIISFGQVSDATGLSQANTIKNETVPNANTPTRVGTNFVNIWNSKGNKQEANTWTGAQTFTSTSTEAGLRFGTRTSNPSSVTAGNAFYNTSTNKLMVANGSSYLEIGSSNTASNGLTLVGSDVQLGGSLTDDVTVNGGAAHSVNFSSVNNFSFSTVGSSTNSVGGDFFLSADGAVGMGSGDDFTVQSTGGVLFLQGGTDVNVPNLAGSGDRMVVVDDDGNLSHAAIPNAGTSSSYTPTHYLTLNVGSSSVFDLYYDRNGNNVHVFGRIDATPSASGDAQIDVSLPIASAFTAVGDVGGGGALSRSSTYRAVFVQADSVNDRVTIQFTAIDNGNHIISVDFSYVVK